MNWLNKLSAFFAERKNAGIEKERRRGYLWASEGLGSGKLTAEYLDAMADDAYDPFDAGVMEAVHEYERENLAGRSVRHDVP